MYTSYKVDVQVIFVKLNFHYLQLWSSIKPYVNGRKYIVWKYEVWYEVWTEEINAYDLKLKESPTTDLFII